MMRSMRFSWSQVMIFSVLTMLGVLTMIPLYITLSMSQKTNGEILKNLWSLPQQLRPDFYSKAWEFIGPYISNSMLVCVIVVVGVVALSSLNGYVFARLDFTGKRFMFTAMIALMMIPGLLILVPAFLWYKEFPLVGGNDILGNGGHGFLDSRFALIIYFISGGQIFGTFLCRSFFESLPETMFEAARLDGASEFQVWLRIAMPLCLPVLATLSIITMVTCYNDYIWPLITISDNEIQVFSVGVTQFGAEGNLDFGPMMAGYVIGSIPLILVFSVGMRFYIEGLTKGAIKS